MQTRGESPLNSGKHLIEVIITDGTQHYLEPAILDVLLEKNQVGKFKRSSGWVTVGINPIRVKKGCESDLPYYGPERRSADSSWL